MEVGNVLIAGKGVTDQNGVAVLGIERAVGLVGDLERSQIDAGIERQRLVRAETDDERMGIVGLAQAVDVIKCDAEIGLDHPYNPAGEWNYPVVRVLGPEP